MRLDKRDQFTLLEFETVDEIDELACTDILKEDIEAGNSNFIFDVGYLPEIGEETAETIKELNRLVVASDGIMVVSGASSEFSLIMEESGIIATPTFDEASDYIFMEILERQLLEEGNEDDENE